MHQALSHYNVDTRESAAEQQLRRGLDLVQEAFDNKVLYMTDEVNHWKQTSNAQKQQITLLQNEIEELKLKFDELSKSSTSVIAERRALMVSRNALLDKYNTLRKWALQLESFKKTIFQMLQEGPQAPMSISELEKTYFSEFEGGLSTHLVDEIVPTPNANAPKEEQEPDSMFLAEYMVPHHEDERQYEDEDAYQESVPQLSSFLGHDSDVAEYETNAQVHGSMDQEVMRNPSPNRSVHNSIHVSLSQPEHSSFMPDLSTQPENLFKPSVLGSGLISNSTPLHNEENVVVATKDDVDSFLGNFSLHSNSNSQAELSKLSSGRNPPVYDQGDSSSESGIAITSDTNDQASDIDVAEEQENHAVSDASDLKNSQEIHLFETSHQSNVSHHSSGREPIGSRAHSNLSYNQANDDMEKSLENSMERSTLIQRGSFVQAKLEESRQDRSYQSDTSQRRTGSPQETSKLNISASSHRSQQKDSPNRSNMNVSRTSSNSSQDMITGQQSVPSQQPQSPSLEPRTNYTPDFANTPNFSRASFSSQRSNGHQVTPVRIPAKAGSPDSARYSDISVGSTRSTASSGRKFTKKEIYAKIKETLDHQQFSEFAKTVDDLYAQRISLLEAEDCMRDLIRDPSLLHLILKMLQKQKTVPQTV